MQQPVKLYDPLEPVIITLTQEEWSTVLGWLEFGRDYHKAKREEVLANIKDPAMRAEWSANHERGSEEAEHLIKTIEAVLHPQIIIQEE